MFELSIIIVNWNAGEMLRRCVESVANSGTQASYEILIIDNASSDDSLALIDANNSSKALIANHQLRIVQNTDNVGFGRAVNQGFALTTSPFVFILNPDAEVNAGAIDTLIARVKTDPMIGGAGPKILNGDGSTQTSVFFNPPCAWHTFFWQLKLYHLLPPDIRGELLLGRHWNHNRLREVPMLIGAALMVRRSMIDQVGVFNEEFHMYGEDNEWCWRIRRAGWKLVFDPSAVVTHLGGVSAVKRWSTEDRLRVKLEAGFKFEQLALSKTSLIANQLANCVVVSMQIAVRRIGGVNVKTLQLVKEIHQQHLKQAFKRENRGEQASNRTHRRV